MHASTLSIQVISGLDLDFYSNQWVIWVTDTDLASTESHKHVVYFYYNHDLWLA